MEEGTENSLDFVLLPLRLFIPCFWETNALSSYRDSP
jgi:hypothetical protein